MTTNNSARTEADYREMVRHVCAEHVTVARCDSWAHDRNPSFSRELARRGLIGVTWPAALGGADQSNVVRFAITEELLRAGAPVAYHWAGERQIGPGIIAYGSRELQEEFCPRLSRAEISFALGMSEPDAGSDLAAVRTTAVSDGDVFVLNGRKIWTSGAHVADYLYVLARTTPRTEDRHAGLSEFLVDADAPGITVTPIVGMDGEHHFNEVLLDNVAIPRHRLLGREGNGWQQVTSQLAFERGGPERYLSMYPLLAAVIEEGLVRANERPELDDLLAQLSILRQLSRDIARAMDDGHSPTIEAATSKLLGNRLELSTLDFVRTLIPRCENKSLQAEFTRALRNSPQSGIRGGAAPLMLAIVAKGIQ
ncbi:acyl-CoA dehydrogenase family protein [Rhodococcoides fascians]|uniref:acyl-CoA dehydrogenase family protein n=1 Tax=Rhodococcoides fascians TaxID=1828 RepID=UPI00050C50DD|nr:acyl-CoA dehydrogenase family protein [Rhodococcus fascians]